MALFRRRSRVAGSRVEPHARFQLRVHLLPTAGGGRETAVFSGYRPQLFIGQRYRDGSRSEWDCEWTFSTPPRLEPGDEGVVIARLMGLPDGALHEDHHLEFYEGSRKVAEGYVMSVLPPARGAADDPLVFAMRDAFEGAAIISVFHEEDGDWQFLTGDPLPETAGMAHLSHVLALDPELSQLIDMPKGMWAHRPGPGQPWQIEPQPLIED